MRHLLAATAAILFLAPAASGARLAPLSTSQPKLAAQQVHGSYRYSCHVEQRLKSGIISLTRLYTDAGERDAGDFMRWHPEGDDSSAARRPLELELSYIWDEARHAVVEPRKIEVRLHIKLDTDLPEVGLIQMQRPFPVEPHGIVGSTALSTQVFPYAVHDMQNGHGELPLGDLLAYAEGYDALGWTLIRPSDRLGGSKELARGTIDIAALREAVAALPGLRKQLALKTAELKARCERIPWPEQIVY